MTQRITRHRAWVLCLIYPAAIAAGWVCARLRVPLPWMIGPLLTTALLSIMWRDVAVPKWSRWAGQLAIASAVALNLTPQAVAHVGGSIGLMLASAVALIVFSAGIALLLVRTSGVDKATALFACLPGGPLEMAALAERYGGRGGLVAFSQTLRIAAIVSLVPALLIGMGNSVRDLPLLTADIQPAGLSLVLGIGLLSALILHRLNIANAFFVGPLLGVGFATLAGAPLAPVPWIVIIVAQIALGASLGAMFSRDIFRSTGRFVLHACFIAAVLIAFGVALGLAIAWWNGQPPGLLILANAPGSVTEMAVTAKTLMLDVSLVTAYHLFRILMIVPTAELIFRAFIRLTELRRGPGKPDGH